MIVYFDASALVKRYVREPESSLVRQRLKKSTVATSRLSEVEIASALVRRCREEAITARQRDRALAALLNDFSRLYIVELIPEVSAMAIDLLVRCRLRAGDAIQLAACLYLQRRGDLSVELVSYDTRLTEAARLEGVTIAL